MSKLYFGTLKVGPFTYYLLTVDSKYHFHTNIKDRPIFSHSTFENIMHFIQSVTFYDT